MKSSILYLKRRRQSALSSQSIGGGGAGALVYSNDFEAVGDNLRFEALGDNAGSIINRAESEMLRTASVGVGSSNGGRSYLASGTFRHMFMIDQAVQSGILVAFEKRNATYDCGLALFGHNTTLAGSWIWVLVVVTPTELQIMNRNGNVSSGGVSDTHGIDPTAVFFSLHADFERTSAVLADITVTMKDLAGNTLATVVKIGATVTSGNDYHGLYNHRSGNISIFDDIELTSRD